MCRMLLKSGKLNFLEHSGPHRACYGIHLPFMKLYMFRAVPLPIIRILFTIHSAVVYVIQVWRQLSSRRICFCSKAVYKKAWHIPLPSVQWISSWWWTEELPETCVVSRQNKLGKLMHLVGFIINKFVTMHGHMNVKCSVILPKIDVPERQNLAYVSDTLKLRFVGQGTLR